MHFSTALAKLMRCIGRAWQRRRGVHVVVPASPPTSNTERRQGATGFFDIQGTSEPNQVAKSFLDRHGISYAAYGDPRELSGPGGQTVQTHGLANLDFYIVRHTRHLPFQPRRQRYTHVPFEVTDSAERGDVVFGAKFCREAQNWDIPSSSLRSANSRKRSS